MRSLISSFVVAATLMASTTHAVASEPHGTILEQTAVAQDVEIFSSNSTITLSTVDCPGCDQSYRVNQAVADCPGCDQSYKVLSATDCPGCDQSYKVAFVALALLLSIAAFTSYYNRQHRTTWISQN